MTHIDRASPVMITGATGYVAGWIVRRLLDEGMMVHAPIREPANPDKTRFLDELAANSPGTIRYFQADLLVDGAYREAMAGCELVIHTASPFATRVRDPQSELVAPALLGTRNVLEEANRSGTVKRVVLTSSCAAIYGDNCDLRKAAGGQFTESDWNVTSSLKHQPYSYSKTLAEREAWRIAEAQQRWDLVALNPSLVIGPGINPRTTSESFRLIKQLGDGAMKRGVPAWEIGVVDVRDVAEAHWKAGFTPEAQGRCIISARDASFLEIAQPLLAEFGRDYPIPRRTLPKWLIWLVGPLVSDSMTRKMISRNVGWPFRADNRKSIRELGLTYRPLEESITDFFRQMIEHGLLKAGSSG